MHPYRPGSTSQKIALWLPGVVCVEGGLVRFGPLAGWRPARGIDDWKREVVVVETRALPDDARPEQRLQGFPRLRQAALACPLVAFPPEKTRELIDAGRRVYTIGWHRVSGGGYLGAEGGGQPTRGVGGELYGLPVLSIDGQPPPDQRDDDDPAFPSVDRILRAISDGVVTEEAVELATDLLDVLDSPLQKRPAERRDIELAHWEAWLEERFAEAAPHEEDARALARALAGAPPGEVVPVPFYGESRRIRLPEMVIGCSDQPDEKEQLTLPASEQFQLSDVEARHPLGLHIPFTPAPRRKHRGWLWGSLGAGAILLWWLVRR